MENRRTGFSDEELNLLAEKIAEKVNPSGQCRLTEEQQKAVVELITAKKKVVRVTLWLIGALVLWVAKDVYLYIMTHITLGWGNAQP